MQDQGRAGHVVSTGQPRRKELVPWNHLPMATPLLVVESILKMIHPGVHYCCENYKIAGVLLKVVKRALTEAVEKTMAVRLAAPEEVLCQKVRPAM